MVSLLDTALTYTEAGWPIFPLEPHGKQPLGKLAPHGLKDATLEEEIVRRWWKAEPQANIAVPTGIVFDVGDIDSAEALGRFQELCHENGTDPATFPRAKTGRGGRHIFVTPTGVGNKVDVIPGMDWRGKGGYVVVPDSVHPSGTTYEWILRITGEPPPCPPWLLELITKPVLLKPALVPTKAPEAYVRAAMEAELAALRSASTGTRNDTLNRAAYALGQMVGADWIRAGQAGAELRAAAYATGLEEPEVERTIRSGLEDGMAHPRQAPAEGWGNAGVIRQGAQSERSGLLGSPPLGSAMTSARPVVYTAEQLEHKEIVEPRAVIPGVVYVGLNMLAGKGKLGKSWLALAMGLGVASGGEILNQQVPAAEVLYLALEDTERRLKVRIAKLWPKKWPATLHISHQWLKLDEGGIQAIEEWLGEHPTCSLVIIDVWKRLRHKRQKNASLYDEDYEHLVPLQAIAQRYEVGILVVHHTRKAAAEDVFDEISGSGGVLAALDSCIILHRARSEADGEIWVTGRDLEEAHLALKFEDGHWSLLGSAREVARSKERREILEAITDAGKMITVAELAVIIGKPRNTVNQLVFKMLTAGELRRSNSTYGLPVITNEGKGSNSGNHGNQGRLLITGTRKEGCPACGKPAYSLRGNQKRCHACGELYG